MEVKKIPEPGLEFYRNPNWLIDDARYGLEKYKPFDKDTKNFSQINVVVIGPSKLEKPFKAFWKKLIDGIPITQKYDQPYEQGFEEFLQVNKITTNEELEFYKIDDYQGNIKKKYESSLQECINSKGQGHLILLIQPEDEREFNFRNELKLKLLREKAKSQFVKPQTILKQDYLGSVINNFAVGLYAKYGGTPWKLKDPNFANTMVLGISFHYIRPSRRDAPERTIFGFSEIVDEFGYHVGMTVNPITFKTEDFRQLYKHRSLFIPKEQIKELVEKSIEKYKRKTDNIVPSKIIIHKTSFYHTEEVEGIKEGISNSNFNGEYALVHLQNDTGYKTYRVNDYKSMRGVFLKPNDKYPYGVLWTVGVIPARYKRQGEWKYWEKSGVRIGTATPIGIALHKQSNVSEMDLDFLAEQALALTKMRWNNVEPGVREPISTYFARNGGRFLTKIWNEHNKEIDMLMENLDARFLL